MQGIHSFGVRIAMALVANLKARATAAAFALLVLAPTLAAAETPANPAFRTAEDQPDFPASGPVRWVSSELQITYRDGAQFRVELDALTKAANVWSAVACADVTLNVTEPPFADVLVERIRNWSARGLHEGGFCTSAAAAGVGLHSELSNTRTRRIQASPRCSNVDVTPNP